MDKTQAREKYSRLQELYKGGQYQDALAEANELDSAFPNTTRILFVRARCLEKVGDVEAARGIYRRLVDEFQHAKAGERLARLGPTQSQKSEPEQHSINITIPKKLPRSLTQRFKDTGYLLKHSFLIIGRDRDILTPTIRLIVYSFVLLSLVFGSVLTFLLNSFVGFGVLTLFFSIFILLPYRFFFDARRRAAQSWIVFNTITGEDIDYKDAMERTKTEKNKLRVVALVDILFAWGKFSKGGRGGPLGILINIFLSALGEVWDLLGNFMVPAVVVERKPLKELAPQLKSLKNNIPGALVGVFGIDFVGDTIKTLLIPLYTIVIAASIGVAYLLAPVLETTAFPVGNYSFSWVPIFAMTYFILLFGTCFKELIDATKVIYFTIFYTALTRPDSIAPDLRDDLTHYLRMEV